MINKIKKNNERSSGVLMPIFSLPNKYGIGTFGRESFKFVDFLKKNGQKYWQILPINVTSFGNSPYSCLSSFAGNYLFIDFDLLCEEGLLNKIEYANINFGSDLHRVDYEKIYDKKKKILKIAFNRFKKNILNQIKLKLFLFKNKFFIYDYASFMVIKDYYGGSSFNSWEKKFKYYNKFAIKEFINNNKNEFEYYIIEQYFFYKQWNKLKKYANKNGISIIGDIPIYSAYDSADVWANSENFYLDEEKNPIEVGGCPPDAFSDKGQLWGNPIYNYDYIKKNKYKYFLSKFKFLNRIYDVIRIDHFRGFESYYAIPYGNEDAKNGKWKKGPGIELFNILNKKIKNFNVIAEDLGLLTDDVKKLLVDTKYPGMKVLQFAFKNSGNLDNMYLPHNYTENSVAYIGTHDNDTFVGWYKTISEEEKKFVDEYLKVDSEEKPSITALKVLYNSKSNLVISTIQDLLSIDSVGRINTPSTISNLNWSYRFTNEQLNDNCLNILFNITKVAKRC